MFNRCEICFAILFVVVGSVSNFICPHTNMICKCTDMEYFYNIVCNNGIKSSLDILYEQGNIKTIDVKCKNIKWSDFVVHNVTKYETTHVYFKMCDLPNASLKTITDMLGATNVKELHFNSYKNFSSFKRLHLQGFKNLSNLDISYNNMYIVDIDLLANLPNLKSLEMRKSNIHSATNLFYYVPKLQILDLGENTLETINPGTFDRMSNLEQLFLNENNIIELQSKIFDKLVHLQTLNIEKNNLVSLPEDIFGKLKNLEKLYLARNNFTSFPNNLLKNNTKLQVIDLAFNNKNWSTLPDGFFSNLAELDSLYLQDNGFEYLPENLLWGCFSLNILYLNKNYLQFLEEEIFRDLKKLNVLKLDSNELEELPDFVFANLSKLGTLDLSKNRISSINNQAFHGLFLLKKLNMADNHLSVISNKAFTSLHSLRIVNFSNNNLTLDNFESENKYESLSDTVAIQSPFAVCCSLEELYLGNNRISQIFDDWIFNLHHLRILDLKRNYILTLFIDNFSLVTRSIEVDLTYNKIQHIYFNYKNVLHFVVFHSWLMSYNIDLLIDNNPLHCDCTLYNYLSYVENKIHPGIVRHINIKPGNLTCVSPKEFQNVRVTHLRSETLNCTANTSVVLMCPVTCNCFRKENKKVFIIDCSRKNLTNVPRVTKLHDIWRVKLNLSNNQLTQIPNLTELGYGSVSELILSYNNISEIFLKELSSTTEVLELHSNKISKISTGVLNFLRDTTHLTRLTLHDNPWICDCSTTDFLDFILIKNKIIADLHNVTCYGKNTPVSNMTVIDFCPDNSKEQSYIRHIFMFLFVFIVSISVLICCIYPHSYVQSKLTVFKDKLFARRSIIDEDELNEDKLYSIFVSYSQNDHDFVINELVPELENDSTSMKLCLPYRDWLTDEWTAENIIKSMELSSRMIMVVSPSFLENVWAKAELRFAHCQALGNNEADLILILYGDIKSTDEHLGSELKTYINSNTYIKWGDPLFWKKLKLILKGFQLSTNRSKSVIRYYKRGSEECILTK